MSAGDASVISVTALTWLPARKASATVGLVLFGFFLGPIFPAAMAVVPRLITARPVPTSIGIMNAGSVVGGSSQRPPPRHGQHGRRGPAPAGQRRPNHRHRPNDW
jgi:hypothetical protein